MRRWLVGLIVAAVATPAAEAAPILRATGAPRAGVDAAGNVILTWARADDADGVRIQALTRDAATGRWSAPVTLSARAFNITSSSLAVAPNGDAIAAWTRQVGRRGIVELAARTGATGAWSPGQVLVGPGVEIDAARVGVAPDGQALVIWRQTGVMWGSVRLGATSPWTEPRALGQIQPAAVPQLAVNSTGTAAVAWESRNAGATTAAVTSIVVDIRTGAWGPPQTLAARPANDRPVIPALDAAGNALVVWTEVEDSAERLRWSTRLTSTDSWTPPQDLAPGSVPSRDAALAVGPGGTVAVLWTGDQAKLNLSTRPNFAAPWSAPQPLPGPPALPDPLGGRENLFPLDPRLTFDASGGLVATWLVDRSRNNQLWTARQPAPGAPWSAWRPVSRETHNISTTLRPLPLPNGGAVAVWDSVNEFAALADSVVQVAVLSPGTDEWGPPKTISPVTLAYILPQCERPRQPGVCRLRLLYNLNTRARLTVTIRGPGGFRAKVTRPGYPGENYLYVPSRPDGARLAAGRYRVDVVATRADERTAVLSDTVVLR